jgi:hypothetical protein
MRVLLMHRDRDFEPDWSPPENADQLVQDLGLEPLLNAMADGNALLLKISSRALLASLIEPSEIGYRQAVLGDCLEHPEVIRRLYQLASDAVEGERKIWGYFFKSPDIILHHSLEVMAHFIGYLHRLRQMTDEDAAKFKSEGLKRFFAMIREELDDPYFATLEEQLRRLRFPRGVLISARLGKGNKGSDYVLRKAGDPPRRWRERLLGPRDPGLSFEIAPRDETGARALAELQGRGVSLVAEVLGHSADHILGFFTLLRAELGFYVGCLNLRDWLERRGAPICVPECGGFDEPVLHFRGLYDASLALLQAQRVVGNDLASDEARLIVVTGANQGGKSTFLRSLGQAFLMTQCGMFAAAERLSLGICDGLFTHFKREEDATMQSGKLDEELNRLSRIADRIRPGSVLLGNESFASTNEWEGSEIGRQVIGALLQAGVRVFMVTHLFNLADGYRRDPPAGAIFLRAERRDDGSRTFRILPGDPLPTSHGKDLHGRILGDRRIPAAVTSREAT